MNDLKVQVEESAHTLEEVWTDLTSVNFPSKLPLKCRERWSEQADLHRTLKGTADIFPSRYEAWRIVQTLSQSISAGESQCNLVVYCGHNIDFAIARHLALTAYVVVTWSIYDRLANVCGRLAGVAELAKNPKQNPKVCEDFLDKKDIMGFGMHLHLQQAYKWPLKVAYKIRNWLVHEGYEIGSTKLFAGNRITDGFRLHEDAACLLEKNCEYNCDNGKIDCCCLTAAEECWPRRDVLEILESYHAEIDKMFIGLVKWTTEAFHNQVNVFAVRT